MESLIAGMVSGVAQTIVGHPFDTLKTWRQCGSSTPGTEVPRVARRSLAPGALYRGVKYPLMQAPPVVGVAFGVNEAVKDCTNSVTLGAAASGAVTAAIICPLDYYKVQAQQYGARALQWNLTKAFANLPVVVARETPSNVAYFGCYDALRKRGVPIPASGAAAGVMAWMVTYPLDTVKTRMQARPITFRQAWSEGGLWRGLTVCCVRASIVNAFGFWVYEGARECLRRNR